MLILIISVVLVPKDKKLPQQIRSHSSLLCNA